MDCVDCIALFYRNNLSISNCKKLQMSLRIVSYHGLARVSDRLQLDLIDSHSQECIMGLERVPSFFFAVLFCPFHISLVWIL